MKNIGQALGCKPLCVEPFHRVPTRRDSGSVVHQDDQAISVSSGPGSGHGVYRRGVLILWAEREST